MEKISQSDKAILYANKKGYVINDAGELISPRNKVVAGSLDKDGYRLSGIRVDGKPTHFMFHRLMAYQKFGDKILDKNLQVRHLNGNKLDNSVGNIGIGTASENNMDKPKSVRLRAANIAASKVRKYDKEEVRCFYKQHGWSKTMEKFNISSKGTLSYILNK